MDSIRRNKILGWAVMLLIVMNVVLLGVLWMGRQNNLRKVNRGKGGEQFLEQRLELKPDQITQLKKLRANHFDRMKELRAKSNEARKALHDLWKTENGAAQTEGLAERVGQLQADIELEVFSHFSEIREMCDDKQKAVFDSIIDDVLVGGERRGGPGGNRPPQGKGPDRGGHLPPPDGR